MSFWVRLGLAAVLALVSLALPPLLGLGLVFVAFLLAHGELLPCAPRVRGWVRQGQAWLFLHRR